jgi:CheY-like chemotaxis protein
MNAAKSLTPVIAEATVLIVEDEVLVRMMIADHLRTEGLRVIEARDGDEAVAILGSGEPVDLVMTDIWMPGSVDGVKLAREAKEIHRLPVIMVSGHYSEAKAAGLADAFFSKPYDLDSIHSDLAPVF